MAVHLDAPQSAFAHPPIDQIPDEDEDKPEPGKPLELLGPFKFPALVFGAASLSHHYNNDDHLAGLTPVRTIRLALRYGISSFDTSPYYGSSEIILGSALRSIKEEFPRFSYKLTTKCGRYGPTSADFDYSPATIRASVERSLARLQTEYLDAVYLHDVEFVCTPVGPNEPGDPTAALNEKMAVYRLAKDDEGKIWGEGDSKILEAVAELRKMQEEGLILHIGITGYPLPTLLRIALLVRYNPPYKPLDLVLSYCHLTLQNNTLNTFGPLFHERAKVCQVLNASPLSMGLLTPTPPPWHPAPEGVSTAAKHAYGVGESWAGALPNLALGYGMRHSFAAGMAMAVGFSSTNEVHESVKILRERQGENRWAKEAEIIRIFEKYEVKDYSWRCP